MALMNAGPDEPEVTHERAATQHLMRRLDGFARALGLDEAATRQIVEKVATDMPEHSNEDRMIEARTRMIMTAADHDPEPSVPIISSR